MAEELIRLKDLVKIYDTGAIKVLGLKRINLTIHRGEFVAIMGKSGSGKSTLMNILGCLDRPSMGHYYLDGIDVASLNPNQLSEIRNRKIGFVFQSFNLISRTSALKNVELPMTYAKVGKKARRERAMKLLDRVGLLSRAEHMPNELSGGQRQRVAIARALANEPPLILADEPTGNLDTAASEEIMGLFSELHDEGATVVVVTHEENIAEFTDRIIRFQDGLVISDVRKGKRAVLFENMSMAFSAIKVNKMRSFLTMLGIIIGIGSVISIVSIGDTMRSLFSDLYKDVGVTQAYMCVGYWIDDRRMSDYFTLDDMERVKEVFGDSISYIDSAASTGAEAVNKKTKVNFDFTGIDYNYIDVQPVDMVYGRYLNEGDILGRKKNVVMDVDSAMLLFGMENAVGQTFRTDLYGNVDEFTVVGVYKKEMNAFQALMMGGRSDRGSAFLPYTLLTWPNDYFYYLRLFASEDVDLKDFFDQLKAYVANLKGRNPEDMYMETAMEQMNSVDTVMGGLSAAVGGIAAISLLVGGIGIMNIMLVSVTERTREIGIRKSLGAKTRDILIQFLTESAILSACGGVIGILIGVGLVSGIGMVFGIGAVIRPSVVILAVSFSAAVGVFFGLYPASKAAKADPIDALRYE